MVSLINTARAFAVCFIAFIAIFCVVFWEDHRHEWVLYLLMLLASVLAVIFFRYLDEIDTPDVRVQYKWNVRHLYYTLCLSGFLGNLMGVYWTASIIQSAGINIEEAVKQFSPLTLTAALILCVLWVISLALAYSMYRRHWSVLNHHNCVAEQQRACAGHLRLADGIWMVPDDNAKHNAEEITVIAASTLLYADERPLVPPNQ